MKRGGMVGIDLWAIRNRFETRIRCVAVAACPEVTPYRRGTACPEVTPYHGDWLGRLGISSDS